MEKNIDTNYDYYCTQCDVSFTVTTTGNMSVFHCPCCGEEGFLFTEAALADESKE